MRGQRLAKRCRYEVTSQKSVLRKFPDSPSCLWRVRIERGTGTTLPVFDLPQMQ
jgi:hypothetical protein